MLNTQKNVLSFSEAAFIYGIERTSNLVSVASNAIISIAGSGRRILSDLITIITPVMRIAGGYSKL